MKVLILNSGSSSQNLCLYDLGRLFRRPGEGKIPSADLEGEFGPLITVGNQPTPNQNGTGERPGLFRDAKGTIWGLPLTITTDGAVLGCASPSLRDHR